MTEIEESLSDWRLKLENARIHGNRFKQLEQEYFLGNPAKLIFEIEENLGKLFLEINEYPSKYLGLVLGDAVNNYRSALDCALFSLVKRISERDKSEIIDRKISFIISENQKNFYENSEWHQSQLNKEILDDIAQVQPFALREHLELNSNVDDVVKNSELGLLKQISNADKHRSLSLVFNELNMLALHLPKGVSIVTSKFEKWPWESGDLIYTFVIEPEQARSINSIVLSPEFALTLDLTRRAMNSNSVWNLLQAIDSKVTFTISKLEWWLSKVN